MKKECDLCKIKGEDEYIKIKKGKFKGKYVCNLCLSDIIDDILSSYFEKVR